MIVWRSDAGSEAGGKWALLGEDAAPAGETADVEIVDVAASTATVSTNPLSESTEISGSNPLKRPLSPSIASTSSTLHAPPKRARGDPEHTSLSTVLPGAESSGPSVSHVVRVCHAPQLNPEAQRAIASSSKGPFLPAPESPKRTLVDGDSDADIFLSDGWRERWCRCNEVRIFLSKKQCADVSTNHLACSASRNFRRKLTSWRTLRSTNHQKTQTHVCLKHPIIYLNNSTDTPHSSYT